MAKRGQNLYEITFIGVCVLGIAMIGFFTFGGNLANIFKQSNVANLFSGNRTAKTADTKAYLSNVNLSVNGGTNFQSPVESVISGELSSGQTVETSGGVGSLNETVAVAQAYVNQLESFLKNPPSSLASVDSTQLQASLDAYNSAITGFVATNGATATSPLEQALNNVQLAINLNDQGTLASNLIETAQAYLSYLPPDSQYGALLNTYVNDLVNLGGSLNYKVDSRPANASTTSINASNSSTSPTSDSTYAPTSANEALAAQVDSYYNILQGLGGQFASDFGGLSGVCQYGDVNDDDNCYMSEFEYYISAYSSLGISCDCNDGHAIYEGCWNPTYDLNGTSELNSDWHYATTDLTDGSAIQFYSMSDDCTDVEGSVNNICAMISVDTNLASGAAILGVNTFDFWLTADGSIIPQGTPSGDGSNGDCNPGSPGSTDYGYSCSQQIINLANDQSGSSLTVLQSLQQQLAQLQADTSLSADQQAQIAKTIQIYRQGTYSQIMPNSYNSAALCNSIGANISSNSCNISL